MNIIIKKGKFFIIDDSKLSSRANNTEVKNALYSAIYKEFLGASENHKYKNMPALEKIQALNAFALKWLESKGLL